LYNITENFTQKTVFLGLNPIGIMANIVSGAFFVLISPNLRSFGKICLLLCIGTLLDQNKNCQNFCKNYIFSIFEW